MPISEGDIVRAHSFSAWSMSLLGKPKMTIVCGNCLTTFRTRDYYPMTDPQGPLNGFLTAKCPDCGKFNYTALRYV